MELIKIVQPDKTLMENTLTEAECNELYKKIQNVVNADDWKTAIKENFGEEALDEAIKEDALTVGYLALMGGATIFAIIAAIRNWIKNKYRLTVTKLYDQSKELNDIYTKVEDLLEHDKKARFKHRNDKINCKIEKIVMIDKKTGTVYSLYLDNLTYDSQSLVTMIREQIESLKDAAKKERGDKLRQYADAIIYNTENTFTQNHGYVNSCDPMMKVETYPNTKLEKCIMLYKEWVEYIYQVINIYNQQISYQMEGIRLVEEAYKKLLSEYGKDKDAKYAIDAICKYCLKNCAASLDFNSRAMVIFNEMIKYYAEELKKVYDSLKQ